MINKIYVYIKDIIKRNLWFFIGLLVILLLTVVKIPYEVMMPGGTIDLTDRISIDGEEVDLEGSFNMAYVTVIQGNIPYTLVASVLPDWDVEKMGTETYEKETVEQENMINRLYLQGSKFSAKKAAFDQAGIAYEMGDEHSYVTSLDKKAKSELKVGDDITKVNGKDVKNTNDILGIIKDLKVGDKITLEVVRDKKTIEVNTEIIDLNGEPKMGVSVLSMAEIATDINIEINSKDSESGPSGGMMMALMIYNAITEQDLTHGKKVVGTGTIESDGSVGMIGGVKYKVMGAAKNKADIFLVPEGNYKEAVAIKKKKGYDIEIVSIKTLGDAIKYLEGLK